MLKYATSRLALVDVMAELHSLRSRVRPLRLWMEWVWLLLAGGRDAVRRPDLGFLGTPAFCYENPRFWGLEKLGFPWILSTESRLIKGLHEIFSRVFSSRFCRRESAVETAAPRFGRRKGRIVHGASLALFLIFCNSLLSKFAARTLPRTVSIQKQSTLMSRF
jgi:hypothetical protein